eukprot:3743734-Prymnesium_polylepis.3
MDQQSAHDDAVWSVCFSPDGTRIVSGSTDFSIRLRGGRRLLALLSISCDPGGSGGGQQQLKVCVCVCVRLRGADASTLALLEEKTSAHTGAVHSV